MARGPGPQQTTTAGSQFLSRQALPGVLCLDESALPRGPDGGLLTVSALGQRDKARATTWPRKPLEVPSAAFFLSGVSGPIQVRGDKGSPYEQGKVLEESLGRTPRPFWILRAITF